MNLHGIALLTRGYVSKVHAILQQIPLTPTDGQQLLIKTLELPLPSSLTSSLGVFQPDVIIRSGIEAALADMRANPWLLEYVFASLPQDSLTWKEYGEKSVQAAKTWFLNTHIPIKIVPVLNELEVPCITISLTSSTEAVSETSLGDVNYQSTETSDRSWPSLTGPFTPKSYFPSTGIITLKETPVDFSTGNTISIAQGMSIIDTVGRSHEILEVYDNVSFRISQGTVADFRNSVFKPHRPAWMTHLESSPFNETYRIGVHVGGEPVLLTWLHSIVVFCLLRYKEALFEARGFERSTIQSSDFAREQQLETELVFTRYINMSGYVRHYWPKTVAPVIDAVVADAIRVSGLGEDVQVEGTGVDPNEQLWVGNLDTLDPNKRR